MRPDAVGPISYVHPRVECEWQCGAAALGGKALCGPCHADFLAAEVEGIELCAADFEVEYVLRGRDA